MWVNVGSAGVVIVADRVRPGPIDRGTITDVVEGRVSSRPSVQAEVGDVVVAQCGQEAAVYVVGDEEPVLVAPKLGNTEVIRGLVANLLDTPRADRIERARAAEEAFRRNRERTAADRVEAERAKAAIKQQKAERRAERFVRANRRWTGRWAVAYSGWIDGQGDEKDGSVGDGSTSAEWVLVALHDTREAAEAECRRLRRADAALMEGDPSESYPDYEVRPYRVGDYYPEIHNCSHWSEQSLHDALMWELGERGN